MHFLDRKSFWTFPSSLLNTSVNENLFRNQLDILQVNSQSMMRFCYKLYFQRFLIDWVGPWQTNSCFSGRAKLFCVLEWHLLMQKRKSRWIYWYSDLTHLLRHLVLQVWQKNDFYKVIIYDTTFGNRMISVFRYCVHNRVFIFQTMMNQSTWYFRSYIWHNVTKDFFFFFFFTRCIFVT